MTTLADLSDWLSERLPALLEQHDVPAAGVAVLAEGDVVEHAAGILSRRTMVGATVESVFQIGSVTKLWTSSLVMQLVDEGRVDLDARVRTYLPEFRIADEDAASRVTVRQLLTHTAGFEGDIFTDTGVGDDCIEKYLDVLHDVPQLFPPGAMWSYNNAGFSVLGRLVEVLREKPYDVCLRERLIDPLGITHAATSPYEAILFRAAVGHIQPAQDAAYEPATVWALSRSNIPAGSMLAMSARGLLAFARMQLEDGRAPDGTQVLAPGTAAHMQARQVGLPYLGFLGTSWGLGFERFDTDAGDIVGHDGNTIGQAAFLRMVPDAGVAVALLTNGGNAAALYADVVGHALAELTTTRLPGLPRPPARPGPIDATAYAGTYSCDVADLVVSQGDDGRVWLDEIPKGIAVEFGDVPSRTELVHYRDTTLVALHPDRGMHRLYAFLGDDGAGRPAYLHAGRALVRAAS
ncbi:MAG TPA: serine hydrolase domain-containing protein [Nocardioides sp.]|uniref:serine hydrolase domain-containing protein n=1 Tax=Nocardioides sp. TaxID=35761 RepID=UPI002E374693|nr:serine hydrolase domain-containing protein [Nocardioides sp.]HEX3930147.1 serine hydrolase domain-containing protein [Nocardioides sp.]